MSNKLKMQPSLDSLESAYDARAGGGASHHKHKHDKVQPALDWDDSMGRVTREHHHNTNSAIPWESIASNRKQTLDSWSAVRHELSPRPPPWVKSPKRTHGTIDENKESDFDAIRERERSRVAHENVTGGVDFCGFDDDDNDDDEDVQQRMSRARRTESSYANYEVEEANRRKSTGVGGGGGRRGGEVPPTKTVDRAISQGTSSESDPHGALSRIGSEFGGSQIGYRAASFTSPAKMPKMSRDRAAMSVKLKAYDEKSDFDEASSVTDDEPRITRKAPRKARGNKGHRDRHATPVKMTAVNEAALTTTYPDTNAHAREDPPQRGPRISKALDTDNSVSDTDPLPRMFPRISKALNTDESSVSGTDPDVKPLVRVSNMTTNCVCH